MCVFKEIEGEVIEVDVVSSDALDRASKILVKFYHKFAQLVHSRP